MTDRKPADMTFASWIDKQIAEATERGAFDNLPGAGKPIPQHANEDAAAAWIREYLRKEGMSAEALLPAPLRLRKAIDRLAQAVPAMAAEQDVRDAVAELNYEIREWRRIPLGPPVFVPLVDEEAMVTRWRAARSAAVPGPPKAPADPAPPAAALPRRRWWRRARRGAARQRQSS
jgi:pyruvate/2-oxoglutarate dehydrogenase complex dihydrolipoamide acyltransferase (E2) component